VIRSKRRADCVGSAPQPLRDEGLTVEAQLVRVVEPDRGSETGRAVGGRLSATRDGRKPRQSPTETVDAEVPAAAVFELELWLDAVSPRGTQRGILACAEPS